MNEQTEMPKRKADQSVDEWLEEGTAASEASRTVAAASCNQERIHTSLTAEGQPTGKAVDPSTETSPTVASPTYVTPPRSEVVADDVIPTRAEVATEASCPDVQGAANEEGAAEWFWNLLPQSCYERW